MGGDPEVLQVVVNEIHRDGVAVVVQSEQGFREGDILEIMVHSLRLCHRGKRQAYCEEKYSEIFHFLKDDW